MRQKSFAGVWIQTHVLMTNVFWPGHYLPYIDLHLHNLSTLVASSPRALELSPKLLLWPPASSSFASN